MQQACHLQLFVAAAGWRASQLPPARLEGRTSRCSSQQESSTSCCSNSRAGGSFCLSCFSWLRRRALTFMAGRAMTFSNQAARWG